MKTNLPDIQISPVFDLVSLNYLQWQYLGSFAIDIKMVKLKQEFIRGLCNENRYI